MMNSPADVIKSIKQNFTATCGNTATLSTQVYFANLIVGMVCMHRDVHKMDLVVYAVENIDPDIKTEMETSYRGLIDSCSCDVLTQLRGLQNLQIYETSAEKKVCSVTDLIHRGVQKVLACVPGFNAVTFNSTVASSNTSPSSGTACLA